MLKDDVDRKLDRGELKAGECVRACPSAWVRVPVRVCACVRGSRCACIRDRRSHSFLKLRKARIVSTAWQKARCACDAGGERGREGKTERGRERERVPSITKSSVRGEHVRDAA